MATVQTVLLFANLCIFIAIFRLQIRQERMIKKSQQSIDKVNAMLVRQNNYFRNMEREDDET